MKNKMKNKKAQEEMVGFGFIVIIVAVVLIVFLSIAFNNSDNDTLDSFKVESFLQATLAQTTDCNNGIKYLTIKELIFACSKPTICQDGRISCNVLNEYLGDISELSWNTQSGSSTLGYKLNITKNGEPLIEGFYVGNMTRTYLGASQEITKSGDNFLIEFKAYS